MDSCKQTADELMQLFCSSGTLSDCFHKISLSTLCEKNAGSFGNLQDNRAKSEILAACELVTGLIGLVP